jgi:hypothetical protein
MRTAMLCLAALVSAVVPLAATVFWIHPAQYVRTAVYRSKVVCTPDGVLAVPPNEDFSAVRVPSLLDADVWRVSAEIEVLRPVRMHMRNRSFVPYSEGNRPTPEDMATAGVERGARVHIHAFRIGASGIGTLGWPDRRPGVPEAGVPGDEAMPQEMLERVLPAICEDLMIQQSDPWVAEAVRRGGVPPPVLPVWRRPAGMYLVLLGALPAGFLVPAIVRSLRPRSAAA